MSASAPQPLPDAQLRPEDVREHVRRLIFLERRLGERLHYDLLDPFPIDPSNALDLQAAAARIAEHVGLQEHTFLISRCHQQEQVAGTIETAPGEREVWIEVSDELAAFPAAVLATLAHEITHQYLLVHLGPPGNDRPAGGEEELLTDVAAVLLGLGKLMLNGCRNEQRAEALVDGQRHVRVLRTRVGYVPLPHLVFVHALVAKMRRIPPATYRAGLTSEPLLALATCRHRWGSCLRPELHEAAPATVARDELGRHADTLKARLAELDRQRRHLGLLADALSDHLRSQHADLNADERLAREVTSNEPADPCLAYLQRLAVERAAADRGRELSQRCDEIERQTEDVWRHIRALERLGALFQGLELDALRVVECPLDGQRMRLPAGRVATAACPQCGYRFAADTRQPGDDTVRRLAWFKRVVRWLRGRGRPRLPAGPAR